MLDADLALLVVDADVSV